MEFEELGSVPLWVKAIIRGDGNTACVRGPEHHAIAEVTVTVPQIVLGGSWNLYHGGRNQWRRGGTGIGSLVFVGGLIQKG